MAHRLAADAARTTADGSCTPAGRTCDLAICAFVVRAAGVAMTGLRMLQEILLCRNSRRITELISCPSGQFSPDCGIKFSVGRCGMLRKGAIGIKFATKPTPRRHVIRSQLRVNTNRQESTPQTAADLDILERNERIAPSRLGEHGIRDLGLDQCDGICVCLDHCRNYVICLGSSQCARLKKGEYPREASAESVMVPDVFR